MSDRLERTYDERGWRPFMRAPGITLGPYESLIAMLMWLGECLKEIDEGPPSWRQGLVGIKPRVNHGVREKIITSFVLFGHLDALAGMQLLDRYLANHGALESRRQIFGDIVSGERDRLHTPFAHPLEEGWLTPPFGYSQILPSDLEARTMMVPVLRALKRAGQPVDKDVREVVRKELLLGWLMRNNEDESNPSIRIASSTAGLVAQTAYRALERSVESQRPFFSLDAAGPAWVSTSVTNPQLRVLKVVWDEVTWLPRPTSFVEALSMIEDERITGLRNDIGLWTQQLTVGDLTGLDDLRSSVRRRMRQFRGKSWARRAGQLITYAAVPTSIAEMLTGRVGMGLSVATLGVATQWIADTVQARKRTSWLSLGRDLF